MEHYKICKYKLDDNYQSEWTSIWDFRDSIFNLGKIPQEYKHIEDSYLLCARNFLKSCSGPLNVVEIEDTRGEEADMNFSLKILMLDNRQIDLNLLRCSVMLDEALDLLRYSLREILWLKIVDEHGSYICFGHDYYWLVGANACDIDRILGNSGLYAYKHDDPWV